MYFDRSLKLGGAGASVLLISLDEKQLKYVLQILWPATNNEAEYKALIHGLHSVLSTYSFMGIQLWSSIKSIKIGTAPKKPWALTVERYAC
jgi:ribonuclease HI